MTRRELYAAGSVAFSAAFFLAGYEFVRSASNTLIKRAYGVEALPALTALVPLGVLLGVLLYNILLTRLGPRRTLLCFFGLSFVLLALSYFAIHSGSRLATVFLFVYRETYVTLIIEQYWAFINSSLSTHAAKRLTGPMIGIDTLGAIAGGLAVGQLAVPLGTERMLLFAALSCLPAALIADMGYRRVGEPSAGTLPAALSAVTSSVREFSKAPILWVVLALVVTSQAVSTILGLAFQTQLELELPAADPQTAYSGRFFALLNGVSLAFQFVLGPLLLRTAPIGFVHGLIPAVHIASAVAMLIQPSLAVTGFAYLAFKAFDYSIFRTAKELLYMPLSYAARFRAKALIDVLGYRASKGAVGLAIALMIPLGLAMVQLYAWVALFLASTWLTLVVPLHKLRQSAHHLERTRRIGASENDHEHTPVDTVQRNA